MLLWQVSVVSLKIPCAMGKKGRGVFHWNGKVSVIISYGIMAKSRSKKGISHGRSPAVSRKDNLSSVWVAKKCIGHHSKGPHDWSTVGLWAHKLANISLFLALGVGWHTLPTSQQGCHCAGCCFPGSPQAVPWRRGCATSGGCPDQVGLG